MTIPEPRIYPRTGDNQIVYLKNVSTRPGIIAGDYTIYNDFVNDPPVQAEQRAVPVSHQPRPFDNRQILLHCLRNPFSARQHQPYALTRSLSLPAVF